MCTMWAEALGSIDRFDMYVLVVFYTARLILVAAVNATEESSTNNLTLKEQ